MNWLDQAKKLLRIAKTKWAERAGCNQFFFHFSSLDDSWFERVHPLHEPRDPSHHDATSEPLYTSNQGTTTAPSCSKPQTKNLVKKNYNSKKSLGIKTVRTKRGQHENPNHRGDSGTGSRNSTCHTQKKETSSKKGSRGKSEVDGRLSPSEVQCGFTPPWTNSPITKQGRDFKEYTSTNCLSDL